MLELLRRIKKSILIKLGKDEKPWPTVGSFNERFRDEWVRNALAAVPAGSRLLDAGAGEQQYRKYCAHLDYVSQDFSQYDGQGNGSGLQMGQWDVRNIDIVSDICAIPEPDQAFDALLCTEVLEHLPKPVDALVEFSRLVRPGGMLILTAPFSSLTHFAPYHFATGFNRYFYEYHLEALGFEIRNMDPNGNYFEFVAQELRRVQSVANSFCGQFSEKDQKRTTDAVVALLEALSIMSKRDTGSAALQCHGLNVIAIKRSPG